MKMESANKIPAAECPRCPDGEPFSRHGEFYRSSDRKRIKRFKCLGCSKTFSQATGTLEILQKKRQHNKAVRDGLCSGVSQRRLSLLLGIHRKTVARKLKFLAIEARLKQNKYLSKFFFKPIAQAQFDEMETHEHTKLKPLSIALAVCADRRKILNFKVSVMPAKGHLAKSSREKYGPRPKDGL